MCWPTADTGKNVKISLQCRHCICVCVFDAFKREKPNVFRTFNSSLEKNKITNQSKKQQQQKTLESKTMANDCDWSLAMFFSPQLLLLYRHSGSLSPSLSLWNMTSSSYFVYCTWVQSTKLCRLNFHKLFSQYELYLNKCVWKSD